MPGRKAKQKGKKVREGRKEGKWESPEESGLRNIRHG